MGIGEKGGKEQFLSQKKDKGNKLIHISAMKNWSLLFSSIHNY